MVSTEALFETARDGGQRFYLLRTPADEPKGIVIFVQPWCEEMNKSRRMVTLQSQHLAENGFAVLLSDLAGCGDSSGDFADASWDLWLEDINQAARWMTARYASAPLWIWGLRSGCLLAAQAGSALDAPPKLVLWQPATSGSTLLQQFLRLKVAGEALDGKTGGKVEDLKQALKDGSTLEIAGYELSSRLALGLDQARLSPPQRTTQVAWLEVAAEASETLTPASATAVQKWQEAGHQVVTSVVRGPGFWRTTEIEDAPELITATTAAMQMLLAASA